MKTVILSGKLKGKRIDFFPVEDKKIDLSDIPSFLRARVERKIKAGEILWA